MNTISASLKSKTSAMMNTKAFKFFLVLVAIEIAYIVAKDFSTGFWHGVMSIAGN